MDQYQQQLIAYITHQLQSGVPAETVSQNLVQGGWDPARVQQALQALGMNIAVPPVPAAPTGPYQSYSTSQQNGYQPTGQQGTYPGQPYQQAGGVPSKYKVFQSVADGFRAIRNNLTAYLIATIGGFIISIAIIIGLTIASGFIITAYATTIFSSNPFAGFFMVFAVVMAIDLITYAVASAFMTAASAYPLMSGADHKKDRAADVLGHAILRIPKVLLANLTIALILFAPPLLVNIMLLLFGVVAAQVGVISLVMLFVTPFLYLGGLIWTVLVLFRYVLTPYVVLFEENLGIGQALKRSQFLLQNGGWWFLLKGWLLAGAVLVATALVTGLRPAGDQLQLHTSIGYSIVACVIVVLVNNSMVMLYRNRRLVRGNQQV